MANIGFHREYRVEKSGHMAERTCAKKMANYTTTLSEQTVLINSSLDLSLALLFLQTLASFVSIHTFSINIYILTNEHTQCA